MSTVSILYRDDRFVVVDKPPGRLVHRSRLSRQREAFLLQEVSAMTGRHVHAVHRLDRNTSGALLFALDPAAARDGQAAMAAPGCRKQYLLLARGLTPPRLVCDRPLRDDAGEPRPCRTEFERLAAFPSARVSLLLATLETGRRHQIRRHLNHAGHHVAGDTTHGKGPLNRRLRADFGLPRMFLHAVRLTCPGIGDPDGGIDIRVPLAADLAESLGRIEIAEPAGGSVRTNLGPWRGFAEPRG